MEDSCIGAIFVRHLSGFKQHCKFEIKPLKEQVFQLSRNKWQVYSMTSFSTTVVCVRTVKPIMIDFSTTIGLDPGCKLRLQSHLLYAEHKDEITMSVMHFSCHRMHQHFFHIHPRSSSLLLCKAYKSMVYTLLMQLT